MTRQLEVQQEQREQLRRDTLVRALEFGIVGALANQGFTMRGLAIKYNELDCLLTLKAERDDKVYVSFVGSDSMINCLLKAERQALGNVLRWRRDKYQKGQS